jgi:hypothetical protein
LSLGVQNLFVLEINPRSNILGLCGLLPLHRFLLR